MVSLLVLVVFPLTSSAALINFDWNSIRRSIWSRVSPNPTSTPPTNQTSTPPTNQTSTPPTTQTSTPTTGTKLITNEYAYWNPNDPKAIKDPYWEMDSGSLFLKDGKYWTGNPDDISPNYNSSNGNNSAVFRLNTKPNYGNSSTEFTFKLNKYVTTKTTPSVSWDGAHVFLRYQSQYNLYYASFVRRDGKVVIKKKCPGGPSNNGTYYDLSSYVSASFPVGAEANIRATVQNLTDRVRIELYKNNQLLVAGEDKGVGCSQIRQNGRTGIRGDNADFNFWNWQVKWLN